MQRYVFFHNVLRLAFNFVWPSKEGGRPFLPDAARPPVSSLAALLQLAAGQYARQGCQDGYEGLYDQPPALLFFCFHGIRFLRFIGEKPWRGRRCVLPPR